MKQIFIILIIYLITWFTFDRTNVFNQTDSLWSVYTSLSIVKEGNFDLDEFRELFPRAFHANIIAMNGHYYNYYPYGMSVLAAPYIWIIDHSYSLKDKNLSQKIISTSTIRLEKSISSSLLSIAVCVFFLLSLRITGSISKSMLLSFLFSFCTIIFSTLSRGLWQHVGSVLLLSFVIYLFITRRLSLLIFSAIPLFFLYVIRPTNILPIFFLSIVAVYYLRIKSVYFLGFGFLVFAGFYYTNLHLFGNIVHPYYDFNKVSGSDKFYEALIGNLFSPGRGLFVYSPIFLFSFYGIYLKNKWEDTNILDYALFCILALHWVLVSRNLNWWGGHCYGYRLLSDLIPILMYYLIYFVKYLEFRSKTFWLFLLSAVIAFYINFKGAQFMETYFWNLTPNNIDTAPERNWDWKDAPFMR